LAGGGEVGVGAVVAVVGVVGTTKPSRSREAGAGVAAAAEAAASVPRRRAAARDGGSDDRAISSRDGGRPVAATARMVGRCSILGLVVRGFWDWWLPPPRFVRRSRKMLVVVVRLSLVASE
jgi:hypothetical protein